MARILGVSILSAMKYNRRFNQYFEKFCKTDNYLSMVSCLSGMYDVMRSFGEASYHGSTSLLYDLLIEKVKDCEDRLNDTFIIESNPYFQFDDQYLNSTRFNSMSDETKLDYIVWVARRETFIRLRNYDKNIKTFNRLHLTNECRNTSYLIDDICEQLGVDSKVIKIPAGFNDKINLYNGNGFHYFVIVKLSDKEYIVDCTYRQFFRGDTNNLDRLGVIGLGCCDPGAYMLMNEGRKNVALTILKNGWIRCNDSVLKHYLDGFTLSFRNALYYDWLGKVDYNVGYTIRNYLDFLNGEDLITNYEPRIGLGKQKQPLQNRELRFKIK